MAASINEEIKQYKNMKILNPILPIMDTILGDLTSLQAEGKITHQTIERVALQWYESERNILRKTTNTGREVAFRLLKEEQRLKHDDVVFISDELVIAIEILPSEVTCTIAENLA